MKRNNARSPGLELVNAIREVLGLRPIFDNPPWLLRQHQWIPIHRDRPFDMPTARRGSGS